MMFLTLIKRNSNYSKFIPSSSSSLRINRNNNITNVIIKRTYLTEIQQGLYSFQELTGLPWWLSIATSTLIVRTTLLPLVRLQLIAANKLAPAMPEIAQLGHLVYKSILQNPNKSLSEKIQGIKLFYQGARATLIIHDTPLYPVLLYPVVNIGMFISFIFAVRGIVEDDLYGALGMGGAFWFRDLVYRDDTYILPAIAITCSYLATEISFHNRVGKYVTFLKDFIQCFILIASPISTALPSGVFFYWIPSSLYAMTQSILLKNPTVLKLLRIPKNTKAEIKLPKSE